MTSLYSSTAQLEQMRDVLVRYARLPFAEDSIPGAVMEGVLAYVRGGNVLKTYDFVDVVESGGVGWQVKSTKAATPVTWKRAKIPHSEKLIADSTKSDAGLQALGDAIIDFCNKHVVESINLHKLHTIGYARLIVHSNNTATYFERDLCTKDNPCVFDKEEFLWSWSKEKEAKKKEQLSALHGIHKPSGRKWWAWHGLGENQLHFSGEKNWWPTSKSKSHMINFKLPTKPEKISVEDFVKLLGQSNEVA
jgi:hypothetical protein